MNDSISKLSIGILPLLLLITSQPIFANACPELGTGPYSKTCVCEMRGKYLVVTCQAGSRAGKKMTVRTICTQRALEAAKKNKILPLTNIENRTGFLFTTDGRAVYSTVGCTYSQSL